MDAFDAVIEKQGNRLGSLIRAVLVTATLFLALGATQMSIRMPQPEETQPIEEFYFAPPPPPKLKEKPPEEQIAELDFSIPIEPTPFEISLDFLQVRVGLASESFKEIAFDLDQSIAEYKTDGLAALRVYEKDEVDQPPVVKRSGLPKLPRGLKVAVIKAVVQFRVTSEGRVEDVFVLDCSVPEAIPAITSEIESRRYKPARVGGEAVHSWVRHPYTVRLSQNTFNPFGN